MKCGKWIRRDLRYSTWDSFLSNAMAGAGETFFPAFALAGGASQASSGLIAALPFLIGSTLQLAAPWALSRIGSYRRLIAGLAILQALCFVPLTWLALGNRAGGDATSQSFLYGLITLYWTFGLAAAPAWNSWLAKLVPAHLRPRYFAKRSRVGQAGLLAGLACGGICLEVAKIYGKDFEAFATLFAVSGLFRLFSALCLLKHSEPTGDLKAQSGPRLKQVFANLFFERESGAAKLVAFLLVFAVAVNISGPFFNAFMLSQLHLSYGTYIAMIGVTYLTKIVTFAALGKSARNRDPLALMRLGLIGIALSPVTWVFGSGVLYLIAIQIFGGALWAVYEIGLMLTLFGVVRDEDRTRVLSLINFGSAAMMLVGTAISGEILTRFGSSKLIYEVLFTLSTAARLLAVIPFDHAVAAIRSVQPFTWKPSTVLSPSPPAGRALNRARVQRLRGLLRVRLRS